MRLTEQAREIYDRIGDGHRHAVKRPWDSRVDRILRELIQFANHNGDCIISGRNGYYRPIPTDIVDAAEYHTYMAEERNKVKSMNEKAACMDTAYGLKVIECGGEAEWR